MKLTAIYVEGNMRYERDLAEHCMHVAFWNIFPPKHESDAAKIFWSTRAWKDGIQIKGD